MSNYPPGVTGTEPQIVGDAAWEEWCEKLQPGDRCLARERRATVLHITDDDVLVRYELRADEEVVDWCHLDPLPDASSRGEVP